MPSRSESNFKVTELTRVRTGWGVYGIASFRGSELSTFGARECWSKPLVLRCFRDFALNLPSVSEEWLPDSGRWPFHAPPIHSGLGKGVGERGWGMGVGEGGLGTPWPSVPMRKRHQRTLEFFLGGGEAYHRLGGGSNWRGILWCVSPP